MLNTPSCLISEGLTFIGCDPQSTNFIKRINNVSNLLCDIVKMVNSKEAELSAYCPTDPIDPEPEPEVIDPCILFPIIKPEEKSYLVSVNDLDQLMNDSLLNIETKACELLEKIKLFNPICSGSED